MSNSPRGLGKETYFYSKQIKNWILQFANIFTGMYINIYSDSDEVEPTLQEVGVIYESGQKTVVSLLSDGSQNKLIQLPILGINYKGITPDFENAHGSNYNIRDVIRNPNNTKQTKIIYKTVPRFYKMHFGVNMWAPDEDALFQILEQLLCLFDPTLQIQADDAVSNWMKATNIKLEAINNTYAVPFGEEQQTVTQEIEFSMPMWLGYPDVVRDNVLDRIKINIGSPSPLCAYDANGNLVPFIIPGGGMSTPYVLSNLSTEIVIE